MSVGSFQSSVFGVNGVMAFRSGAAAPGSSYTGKRTFCSAVIMASSVL